MSCTQPYFSSSSCSFVLEVVAAAATLNHCHLPWFASPSVMGWFGK